MAKTNSVDEEKKLGQEGATAAQKELKFITDPIYAKRVDTIGQKLAAVARINKIPASYGKPDLADFTYSFKVVDDKDINAFSLPAGYIYVNKGLIEAVDSDDELAGVLAHEIAHVAHHHLIQLQEKQAKIQGLVMLVLAGMIIGKAQDSAGDVIYGSSVLAAAKLNAYSLKAENDADSTAIYYMMKTDYNPVGVLTVMEKLAHIEALDPRAQETTIYTNHPPAKDRIKNITAILQKNKLPIDRKTVAFGLTTTVREKTVNGKNLSEVLIGDTVIFRPADTSDTKSADRAKAIANIINTQLLKGAEPYEVKIGGDGAAVYVKQEQVLQVLEEDAAIAGISKEALATKVKNSIQGVITKDRWNKAY